MAPRWMRVLFADDGSLTCALSFLRSFVCVYVCVLTACAARAVDKVKKLVGKKPVRQLSFVHHGHSGGDEASVHQGVCFRGSGGASTCVYMRGSVVFLCTWAGVGASRRVCVRGA